MAKKSSSRKKSTAKKIAPFGLILSGLSLVSGIILLAIKLLILMQIYTPANVKWINTALLISLGLFIVGFAIFALLDPKRVREFLTGRQARHGSNALIVLIALVGIIVVVNLIIYQNQKPWDWTEDRQHTLAPETLDTLRALPSKVTAIGFFTQNSSSATVEGLLADFRDNSEGKFDYQIIDPDRNPAMAQQYNVTRDGTVVLVLGDRKEILNFASEQEITSALIRLMNPGERVIYFMTGHGEANIENSGDAAYTKAVGLLGSKNYTVRNLNLRAENEIPADALAIIIAGPTQPLSSNEASLLQSYVDNGGSLVVFEECTLETEYGDTVDSLQHYLANVWGVVFNNDIVIDPTSDPLGFAVSYAYGDHDITKNLQSTITFFPISRSITLTPSNADIKQDTLILTIDRAWGETDFQSIVDGTFEYQANTDTSGPLTIMAVLENTTSGGKLVVIGDSSFAMDLYFDQYGNADLFTNTIDWAAGETDMISLTPKDTTERILNPIQNIGWIFLGLSFLCILPGIIIAGGVISWIARRARG